MRIIVRATNRGHGIGAMKKKKAEQPVIEELCCDCIDGEEKPRIEVPVGKVHFDLCQSCGVNLIETIEKFRRALLKTGQCTFTDNR